MPARSPEPRLRDILEAIGYIPSDLENTDFDAFESDRRKRWLVERGVENVSEASRHFPDDMKARHPGIPWRNVAGIGNVLRHEYGRVAADAMWRIIQEHLHILEKACRDELAALPQAAP
jgi:uncharacterized protein with HEPN domain